MAYWLVRSNKKYIPRSSPSRMAARFGGSFVDGNGNALSNEAAIYQPDLTAVTGFDSKYWVITGDIVSLMDQATRDAVDAAELQTIKDALEAESDRGILKAVIAALIKTVNIRLPTDQKITKAEMVEAIRGEL